MAANNIKFFMMGNLSTKKVMLEESFGNSKENDKDAFQIFNRLSMMSSQKFEERSKVSSKNGNIFFTCHLPNKFYLVLAESTFSESLIFELINEVNNSTIPESLDKEGKVIMEGKQYLKILVDKYEKKKSSIADINNDINDIRLEMKSNVKNLIQNKDNVEDLQKQSDQIKDGGELFAKNANEAKKITCWQNWKLIIIIVLIVIGVLLVIIVPIVTTSSSSSTTETASANTTQSTSSTKTSGTLR